MNLPARYSSPEGHWRLPGGALFSQGVRKDGIVFVAGQMDIDPAGAVRHPGDLCAQLDGAVAGVERVLGELDATLRDVVKLDVCYVDRGGMDEMDVLETLHRHFRFQPPPALFLVPLPALAPPDALVQIEAIAMNHAGGVHVERHSSNPAGHWQSPFSHGIRCGDLMFVGTQMPRDAAGRTVRPGDAVAQAEITLANVDAVLCGFGADLEDVVNFNTRYVGGGTVGDWARAAAVRANIWKTPGKCGTGVPVPTLPGEGMTIRQDAIAVRAVDGHRQLLQPVFPADSWRWPIPVRVQQGVRVGPLLFIGGQVSADVNGNTLHADELAAQVAAAMRYLSTCAADGGARRQDITRIRMHYRCDGRQPLATLTETVANATQFFDQPGPAATATPLPNLGLDGGMVEIEAIAIVDRARP
jgi:enamine deaminase RidA (YjgF/YER057c/UK114 family)